MASIKDMIDSAEDLNEGHAPINTDPDLGSVDSDFLKNIGSKASKVENSLSGRGLGKGIKKELIKESSGDGFREGAGMDLDRVREAFKREATNYLTENPDILREAFSEAFSNIMGPAMEAMAEKIADNNSQPIDEAYVKGIVDRALDSYTPRIQKWTNKKIATSEGNVVSKIMKVLKG